MANERILVVDDNNDLLSLCTAILQPEGYFVGQASKAEDALTMMADGHVDLLLTDIQLPGLTGLELAGKLRDCGVDITVIAMTGFGSMEMAIQALSLGFDEFIVKPFTAEHLRFVVSRGLEKARLRRENARLRALLPLFENMRAFLSASTREELHKHIVDSVGKTIHADMVALLEIDPSNKFLTLVAASGGDVLEKVGRSVSMRSSIGRRLMESSQVQLWKGEHASNLPFEMNVEMDSMVICAPLASRERKTGVLLATGRGEYRESDLEAVAIVSGQAAIALENAQLIREISRASGELRQLNRLKSEFINIAAHELRTPLSVLMGYSLLLLDELTGSQREQMEYIIENASRLRRVAEDLLSLRYLETGEVDLRFESFDVNEAVKSIVEAYRPLASQKEQSLNITIPTGQGKITADRSMVDMMFGNLLSNAIKFSPSNSSIQVDLTSDESQITFAVHDQGQGIPAEERDKIFQSFYQVETSLTRRNEGLGLGLAITREMVLAHRGKIWVESEPGKGSAFFISLPRRPSTPGETMKGVR